MTTEARLGRGGTTVVEVLVGVLLTAFLVQGAWAVTSAARTTAMRLLERSEALETERVGWHVLLAEVSIGVARRDWRVEGSSALPLRVFRGVGELCGATGAEAAVRFRGLRQPEPAKDSVLLMDGSGAWHAAALVGRFPAEDGCGGRLASQLERWTWTPSVEGAILARLFESGSYHLEDRALRYRLGAAGRQPLTPESLVDAASGFRETSAGTLELRWGVRLGDTLARAWTRSLARRDDGL